MQFTWAYSYGKLDNEHTVGHTDNTCVVVLVATGLESIHTGMVLMDIVWIITGIFVSAIAIGLILGKLHGTLII